jgi:ubiquinone/menaquinone biosynthesis C-methylase UbiE
MDASRIYKSRFDAGEMSAKRVLWKVLINDYLQKYCDKNYSVLDIGGGSGEFINNVVCARKYLVDINPECRAVLNPDVEFVCSDAVTGINVTANSIDLVFMSNFLEHLDSPASALKVLGEACRILKPKGRIMIIQPNIRYAYKEYWDFIDHTLPVSDKSLVEALELSGFGVLEVIPRFLPYTTKGHMPHWPWLLRLYLKLPLLWRFAGKQCFVVAEKG